MVDKINAPVPDSSNGDGDSTTPEFVTKAELNAMLNGFRASFKKDFSEMKTALQSVSQPKEEPETQGSKSKVDPEKIEMQRQIKLLLDREKEREVELSSQKLNSSLREQLLAVGTDPRHIEHALAYVNQKQLVKYDEEGNLKMRVNQVDYDIADGAKLWAKQEDAKLYLAPKGAVGSGQKGPVTQQTTQPANDKAKAEQQFNELLKQLPAAMNGV